MSTQNRPSALAQIPPWLAGNDVLEYARQAALKFHPVDSSEFRWRIEAVEDYERRPPGLVKVLQLAAPGKPPSWRPLETLWPSEVPHPLTIDQLMKKRDDLLVKRQGDIVGHLAWISLTMTAAPDDQFITATNAAYESLRDAGTPESGPFFPNLSVKFIQFDRALSRRAGLARVLLRAAEEPAILANRPRVKGDGLVFGSAWHLQSGLSMTRDAYVTPLFLCHSPWVWAATGARLQGVAVFEFGKPLRGHNVDPTELLELFMGLGPARFNACPAFTPQQTAATISWWVERLDGLLGAITNPATYVSQAGEYAPRRHLETLLSVEQLGSRIQSILAHQRDQPMRRMLAFDALDTLDGLGIVKFHDATHLPHAQATLDRLETRLPVDVAAVLLPTARRAVAGLQDCQKGFFLDSRVAGGLVTVPDKRGLDRSIPAEQAASQYLRVLRNGGHRFGGRDDGGRRRDEVLLMAHTGELPDDLVLLPYLYWLAVLADPRPLLGNLSPYRKQPSRSASGH